MIHVPLSHDRVTIVWFTCYWHTTELLLYDSRATVKHKNITDPICVMHVLLLYHTDSLILDIWRPVNHEGHMRAKHKSSDHKNKFDSQVTTQNIIFTAENTLKNKDK